jgi:uncharacterized protein YdeI (YjbR/CyaY-like superfamily)
VDEALCYGWIDGVRKGIDEESYSIRFTPRKAGSTWSNVNVDRVRALADRMQPAGLKAFESRKEAKSGIYSHEPAIYLICLSRMFLNSTHIGAPAWS